MGAMWVTAVSDKRPGRREEGSSVQTQASVTHLGHEGSQGV